MQSAKLHAFAGLLAGVLLTVVGVGIQAHAHGSERHNQNNDNRASITGNPEELAQRARDLGEHICANIKAVSNCPVTPAADEAVKALSAMQDGYQDGQARMHELLTSANFDRSEFARVQTQQAQAVQLSAARYMQFLADAATALTPEQRQMFSRKPPAGK